MTFRLPGPPEEIPVEHEPIVGYRLWNVAGVGDVLPWLTSPIYPHVWKPRVETRSNCMSGCRTPNTSCRCGIYAFLSLERAYLNAVARARHGRGFPIVVGSVLLWGVVVEYEHGYRAQYAAIDRIMASTLYLEDQQKLARRYAVEVDDTSLTASKTYFTSDGKWSLGSMR